MRVSEYIRERLWQLAPGLDSQSYESIKRTEWSDEFERLMRNRLIMGALRYGVMGDKPRKGATQKHIEYIASKLDYYQATGNQEALVDIANLCLVEFRIGDHPLRHFHAIDRSD